MKIIHNAAIKKAISISESLAGLLSQMNNKQKDLVRKMFEFYMNQYKELRSKHNAESVAAAIHNEIDLRMSETVASEKEEKVTCRNGCAFCCFMKADISDDEAVLLTEYAKEINFEIDYEKLEKQNVGSDEEFLKIPYKDRRCIFLNKENSCSVYEHRPSACRKLLVVSKKEFCDTDKNLGVQVKRLANVEAEVLSSSSLNVRESGGMAKMLLKAKNKTNG